MFPSFIGILDIQSWWEVPSIAYFCSLFRTAFNLLDFDIEELEEALLTDGSEECASTLLTELIVRLLNGCLANNEVSAFNYQMFLRRLFREKCKSGRYNPFNTDIDFQFLPLRTKVEILYALCDFRLDAEDVFELFKNLDAESLRVEPLGWDDNSSAYWYFYGTRLYREDYKQKSKSKKKRSKEEKRKKRLYGDDSLEDPDTERVWQVVCFTEADWTHLTEKFKNAASRVEKELYQSLSENFLPEIPRLFQEKERLQRKRLLEFAPRRTSVRVLQKIKQKEEDKSSVETRDSEESKVDEENVKKDKFILGRESRAKRREQLRSKSEPSNSSEEISSSEEDMPPKELKKIEKPVKPESSIKSEKLEKRDKSAKSSHKKLKKSTHQKGDPPSPPQEQPVKTGRKTNNSLACATGQIVIPDAVERGNSNSTRKILKTSQIFSQSEEDIQTDMYKVLEQLTAHEDAWPFMDPVEEEYAPNYYAVIRRPMDLRKMEERLDSGFYTNFSAFQSDFKLIVNNCRLYNGQDNEYTAMVDNLQEAFDRLTERYIHRASSSDEEIAVEYQIPTPSRKHKLKQMEESSSAKKKKRTHSTSDNLHSSPETDEPSPPSAEEEKKSEKKDIRTKLREGKLKKKHKQHHHHTKHSRSHKPSHHKTSKKEAKYLRKLIHHLKKEKHRKRKRRYSQRESEVVMKHSSSNESLESSNRSRSASPLPSIHTPTPTPTPSPPPSPSDQLNDPDFFKDKYDIIKERRRQTAKDNWDTLVDHKQKNAIKPKKNLSLPEKDKNQKLKETIEKLKAKNEKYKETLMYNNLLPSKSTARKRSTSETHTDEASSKDQNKHEFVDDSDNGSQKSQAAKSSKEKDSHSKKNPKKPCAGKNESATDQALEQAVKDISKWLDNAPKSVSRSTSSSSPAPTNSTEEQDNRLDDDFSSDKNQALKKDLKKRALTREQKLPSKRREIHRTIERLQPGKSKGNLIANATTPKLEEIIPLGPHNKPREIKSVLTTKVDELSPKLSLGSVLPTVGFNLGKDHKFPEEDEKIAAKPKHAEPIVNATSEEAAVKESLKAKPESEPGTIENKSEEDTKEEEKTLQKFSQEKVTPNLSAWFKAFGAPKSSPTPTNKKKNEEIEQDEKQPDEKQCSPKNVHKYDSPPDEISPTPDGGDSPSLNVTATPRQRRTSTGSSVSERSSFSQDLDSPRLQISHTSPLLRSPASPRTDEFQKILYPIINGTVRAGFYQDTTSLKSSPEKSCSPREAPQSPYSPYSQHVYASNSAATTTNPSYYVDHNKSPLPTYGLNQPPPYYDTSKAPIINKPPRVHDDYTALCPDGSYQQSPYSPAPSPYSQHSQHSPYSQVNSPISQNSPASIPDKSPLFPAKKRTYNEELSPSDSNKYTEKVSVSDNTTTELSRVPQNKGDYKKIVQSMSSLNFGLGSASVDDIALALSKKSEALKMKGVKENSGMTFLDRMGHESTSNFNENIINIEDVSKQDKVHNTMAGQKRGDGVKNSSVDMINMGYFASELDRRSDISDAELLHSNRDLQKTTMSKGYGGVAMNLGVNKGASTKYYQPSKHGSNIDIIHNETLNQNILEFDNIQAANQSVSNYGLSEFDIASKKFYAGGTVRTESPIDYGNWKNDNQLRRMEPVHSNYQAHYSIDNNETNKSTSNINVSNPNATNYSKALHSQQLQALAGTRTPMLREAMQQNLSDALRMPSELRIPNPRSMMKSDYMGDVGISDSDIMGRNIEGHTIQKPEKLKQNQTMATSLQYKPSYGDPSSLPLDTLRTIPNLPQMLERYTNNERYLAGYGTSTSSMYHDKNLQMAQIFNKSLPSDVHQSSSTASYSQATVNKDNMSYKASGISGQLSHADKMKQRRKKSAELKVSPISGNQSYHPQVCTTDVLSSVKTSLVPGSAFNFGPSAGMGLSGNLYSDSSGFSLEDFRNTTAANQFMAANYMAAAAAIQQHQLKNNDAKAEKVAKPAHQNTSHSNTGTFPFMSHSQVRAGYQFVGTDPSSPLYQQYLQRHQEELLRHSAPIMGLYPPGYHPGSLGARQPYDAMNRPPWI